MRLAVEGRGAELYTELCGRHVVWMGGCVQKGGAAEQEGAACLLGRGGSRAMAWRAGQQQAGCPAVCSIPS